MAEAAEILFSTVTLLKCVGASQQARMLQQWHNWNHQRHINMQSLPGRFLAGFCFQLICYFFYPSLWNLGYVAGCLHAALFCTDSGWCCCWYSRRVNLNERATQHNCVNMMCVGVCSKWRHIRSGMHVGRFLCNLHELTAKELLSSMALRKVNTKFCLFSLYFIRWYLVRFMVHNYTYLRPHSDDLTSRDIYGCGFWDS